jgi:hypothetical protein
MATKVITLESRLDIHGNEVKVGDTIVYCSYEGSTLYTMKVSRITAFTLSEIVERSNYTYFTECRTSNFLKIELPKKEQNGN